MPTSLQHRPYEDAQALITGTLFVAFGVVMFGHSGLLTALRAAGVQVDSTLGVQVAQRVLLDASGATVAQAPYPQLLTSWSRLYALLRAALPADCLLAGHELTALSQHADGVALHCANGRVTGGEVEPGAAAGAWAIAGVYPIGYSCTISDSPIYCRTSGAT